MYFVYGNSGIYKKNVHTIWKRQTDKIMFPEKYEKFPGENAAKLQEYVSYFIKL